MTLAAVGLGANLGDAARNVRKAIDALEQLPGTRPVRASRLYRTPAWGVTAQPDFINAVALLDTALPARDLLHALLDIERACGRVRIEGERWGPRTLDLDLLLYGDAVIDEPGLRVPHPHLHERAFALLPLLDAWPDAAIPGIGPARECAAVMAADAIEPLP
ncbi:2-amino-4-hydroxy-6-hydroxymethyldihydropteridine diphosphokinase [Thermomonas carbonis]|uniref:2-amino-4-hydroxy-6-hydroxymethyldihydropteridine pyrophosphokinase n=1 Tax=Thermomonas carbonis TaxID=1463158 RepID=A0A7G9SQ59_9GAMM|nr:2-amino-4-hydroxy-6-hydroxymethyldihydropteridine diphosphokinase [Thermomonas carbonis]QNN69984.1 2-amino-4-hydroxy-6-hydroxymethyldihydropteridine diphosphokinase [Thermomonas carbonis]GHB96830.1 2-amino-4-hydroxy-6-hydroxymethyldihydropteridine diphosphokinase [Thermomonas carbonis]